MTIFSSPPVLRAIQTTDRAPKLDDSWKGWLSNLYSVVSALMTMSSSGQGYTAATLPAAGVRGRRAYVTDALAPVFLAPVAGGGAIITPVFDNGTTWIVG
jgi:hypothetical protein